MITEYIAVILTVYVGLWLKRTFYKQSAKTYFKKQVKDLNYQILDTEFKRFKTQEGREELRNEYDTQKARREALEQQIKNNDLKDDNDKTKATVDERKRMDDEMVKLNELIQRLEVGRPEGDGGDYIMNLKDFDQAIALTNSQIDQLRSLQGLLKEYISKEL